MKYKAGDKVRCVKSTLAAGVNVGDVYTVKGFSHSSEFGTHIGLEEVCSTPTECVFKLVGVKPKFKVGDKVRCVWGSSNITIGKVYTVDDISSDGRWYRVLNDQDYIDGYTACTFKLVDPNPVLTPEEVFEHLRKGTELQYRRTSSLAWSSTSAGVKINDNPTYRMITLGEWRVKPEPEVIELNGKKYREIME